MNCNCWRLQNFLRTQSGTLRNLKNMTAEERDFYARLTETLNNFAADIHGMASDAEHANRAPKLFRSILFELEGWTEMALAETKALAGTGPTLNPR